MSAPEEWEASGEGARYGNASHPQNTFFIGTVRMENATAADVPSTGEDIPAIYDLSRTLVFFSLSPIIPLGLICNTISVVVFMSKALRKRAASWYLATLAVSDDVSLLCIMIEYWLKDKRIGFTGITTSHALCVLVTHLSYASRLLSAMLVTSLTIERFIGVVFPLKRASLSSNSHARKVILCEALLCLAVTSFTIFTIGIVKAPYGQECDVRRDRANVYLVFNILFLIVGSIVVPILIICTLNMFILHKIYQRKRYFVPKNMRFNESRQMLSCRSHKDYNIAKLLLVVSSVFVILNIPYCICWFILCFHYFKLIGPFGSGVTWQLYAAKYITSVPYYLNYGINFALYSLCARAFRVQLLQVLGCHGCQKAPQRSTCDLQKPRRATSSKPIARTMDDNLAKTPPPSSSSSPSSGADGKPAKPNKPGKRTVKDSRSMYEMLRASRSRSHSEEPSPVTM